MWHCVQEALWALVSGKVAGWLNVAPCHWLVLWHWVQLVGNPAVTWLGLVVC